jgi:hypothetical protein
VSTRKDTFGHRSIACASLRRDVVALLNENMQVRANPRERASRSRAAGVGDGARRHETRDATTREGGGCRNLDTACSQRAREMTDARARARK